VDRTKLATLTENGGTEQDRDHRERYGMANYLWAPDSKRLLFDSDGRYWVFDLKTGTGVQTGSSDQASGDDPTFSPDGKLIAFIRQHGLYVVRIGDQVTADTPIAVAPVPNDTLPNQTMLNGEVSWIYAEELETRSNYAWSPDSGHIAYLQTDQAAVPAYPLTDWIPTHAKNVMQRYPQPGDENPAVRVGVVNVTGGSTHWIKLPIEKGQDYIPRFGWVDRRTLWIETLSRDQKKRTVYFVGDGSDPVPMLTVTDDKFLDDNYDVWVSDGAIVLSSWKDGHNHVYLYSYDVGNPVKGPAGAPKQLTSGEFDVEKILRVDAAKKAVFYTSNETALLDRQIWQVSFGGERKALTTLAGTHEGDVAPDGAAFVDTFSTRMDPPRMSLCKVGGDCSQFWASRSVAAYGLHAPLQLETKTKDGTTLYATLTLPEGARDAKSVPVILNPYGGATGQTVLNRWGDNVWGDKLLFDSLLAEHGFAVLRTDNRGTPGRGRDFTQAAYHDFGAVQLEDQLTMLDYALGKFSQLDPKRLGWWGWSWGGTFTLYAMTHSDRFQAGVSAAPVTDWRDYDSVYTERYLGLPAQNPAIYKADSVVAAAADLKGHLLLVHGTGDDNVHVENTVQFVDQLVDAEIPYDLQIFPRKTHEILGGADRVELFNRILAHFEQYLKPAR
jgi:dipeptidyl-peptidase 4